MANDLLINISRFFKVLSDEQIAVNFKEKVKKNSLINESVKCTAIALRKPL